MTSDSDNEFQRYLVPPGQEEPARVKEVPPQMLAPIEKAPSGLAPMSNVELEGRAYRGLAGGNTPWWVLVSGCISLILPAVVFMVVAVVSSNWLLLVAMVPFLAVFSAIIWRGTSAKLKLQKERAERQARRQRDMRE